jgi:hypothetical protein
VVVTDKDFKELAAVEVVIKYARSLLCHFHALSAVHRRIKEEGLHQSRKEEIYKLFEGAVHVDNEKTQKTI